jgi:plasmid stabilization system protein ParE
MFSIVFADNANNDISESVVYISRVLMSPQAANSLLDIVEENKKILLSTPKIFSLVKDNVLSAHGIRFVIVKNFLMFFVVEEKSVKIIRFLHGLQNWTDILKM